MENGVRLQRQVIPGNVLRRELDQRLDVCQCLLEILPRQSVHHVEVDVVETGRARAGERLPNGVAPVNAAEPLERPVGKRLCPDGQPVDARSPVAGRIAAFDGAGVSLHRNLGVIGQAEAITDPVDETSDGRRWKEARCPAAKEYADERTVARKWPVQVEIGEQCIDVLIHGQLARGSERIEVTVRAFFRTPGQVHVQRERNVARLHRSP